MKKLPLKLLVAIYCFVFVASLKSQTTLSGLQLEIGPSGANQVKSIQAYHPVYNPYPVGGAIGSSNFVSGGLAVGLGNHSSEATPNPNLNLLGDYSGSLVIGYASSSNNSRSLLVGSGIESYASELNSLFVGRGHYVTYGEYPEYVEPTNDIPVTPDLSLFTGMFNTDWSIRGVFMAGINNIFQNVSDETPGRVIIGRGISTYGNCLLVIGHYPTLNPLPEPEGAFIVGNGTGAFSGSNAFSVFTNGKVILKKRQGNVLMGEFGNPE